MRGNNNDDDILGGMGSLQSYGILSALRTGDPTMDMLLAMSIPLLIKLLVQLFSDLQEYIKKNNLWGYYQTKMHERIIEQASTRDQYGYVNADEEDSQNTILLKAIRLYLHKVLQLDLREAELELTTTDDKNACVGRSHYYDSDDEDEEDSRTVVGALSKYSIVKKPRANQWYELGEFGKLDPAVVRLIVEHNEEDRGEKSSAHTRITHQIRLQSESGEAVDDFVNKSYQWYMQELRTMEDNQARYLYDLKAAAPKSKDGDNSRDGSVYTRYRLSNEKTFKSLFFRQKDSLLKIIQHFQDRSGKYAIEGYPHKLGILLHGPPGSGKTSLIKALAQHTGRSIINVPLARVSTNAELMSIFFDRRKYVEGEHVPVKLGFKDVIFVMEDIDAASKIVKRRGKKADPATLPSDMPAPRPFWNMLLESNEDDCKALVKLLAEKSDELKAEANKTAVVVGVAQRAAALPGLGVIGEIIDDPSVEKMGEEALENAKKMMEDQTTVDQYLAKHARILLNMLEQGTKVDQALVDELLGRSPPRAFARCSLLSRHVSSAVPEEEKTASSSATFMMEKLLTDNSADTKPEGYGPSASWNKPAKDRLNLQGLLNVLDGVVDSPKRIVIMTTNHVEHLDPALIRPGRIDKKLLLGYMAAPDVISMLEHYFQMSLNNEQKDRVKMAMAGNHSQFTPAQIEQLTAEHDEIEDMIQALEDKSG